MKDTIYAVRNLQDCNGRVAVLGYCLGALMVFLTAVRYGGIDAAVAYHGGDAEKYGRRLQWWTTRNENTESLNIRRDTSSRVGSSARFGGGMDRSS
jgi:dienelactone hydrolase